jgi:hypothetical protein
VSDVCFNLLRHYFLNDVLSDVILKSVLIPMTVNVIPLDLSQFAIQIALSDSDWPECLL